MKSTVTINEGRDRFPALVKAAEKGRVITVTRDGAPVAYVLSHERMKAVAETLELVSKPPVMEAVAAHKAGRIRFGHLADIPD